MKRPQLSSVQSSPPLSGGDFATQPPLPPQLPMQSVPPLDDRGGDTTLPPLLSRVWWLFFNALVAALRNLSDRVDALPAASAASPVVHLMTQTTPTRALNVVYQNLGTFPLMVTAGLTLIRSGGVQAVAQARSDSASTPTTVVGTVTTSTGLTADGVQGSPLTFWVLPGNYYVIASTGTVTIGSWVEWQ